MKGMAIFPNCDKCGRFVNPGGPGVSWCQTYTFMDLDDPTYRCSRCTDTNGVKESNCNPKSGPWSGRNPTRPAGDGDAARQEG